MTTVRPAAGNSLLAQKASGGNATRAQCRSRWLKSIATACAQALHRVLRGCFARASSLSRQNEEMLPDLLTCRSIGDEICSTSRLRVVNDRLQMARAASRADRRAATSRLVVAK